MADPRREQQAQLVYGKSYAELTDEQKKAVDSVVAQQEFETLRAGRVDMAAQMPGADPETVANYQRITEGLLTRLGAARVKDFTAAEITSFLGDIAASTGAQEGTDALLLAQGWAEYFLFFDEKEQKKPGAITETHSALLGATPSEQARIFQRAMDRHVSLAAATPNTITRSQRLLDVVRTLQVTGAFPRRPNEPPERQRLHVSELNAIERDLPALEDAMLATSAAVRERAGHSLGGFVMAQEAPGEPFGGLMPNYQRFRTEGEPTRAAQLRVPTVPAVKADDLVKQALADAGQPTAKAMLPDADTQKVFQTAFDTLVAWVGQMQLTGRSAEDIQEFLTASVRDFEGQVRGRVQQEALAAEQKKGFEDTQKAQKAQEDKLRTSAGATSAVKEAIFRAGVDIPEELWPDLARQVATSDSPADMLAALTQQLPAIAQDLAEQVQAQNVRLLQGTRQRLPERPTVPFPEVTGAEPLDVSTAIAKGAAGDVDFQRFVQQQFEERLLPAFEARLAETRRERERTLEEEARGLLGPLMTVQQAAAIQEAEARVARTEDPAERRALLQGLEALRQPAAFERTFGARPVIAPERVAADLASRLGQPLPPVSFTDFLTSQLAPLRREFEQTPGFIQRTQRETEQAAAEAERALARQQSEADRAAAQAESAARASQNTMEQLRQRLLRRTGRTVFV